MMADAIVYVTGMEYGCKVVTGNRPLTICPA